MGKRTGPLAGYVKCERCGHEVSVHEGANGFLYYTCPMPGDGGCGKQDFSRNESSSEKLARKIHKWVNAELRKKWLGCSPAEPVDPPARRPP